MSLSIPQLRNHQLANLQALPVLANLPFQPIQPQNQGQQPPIQNAPLNMVPPVVAQQQQVAPQIQAMPQNVQQDFIQAFQAFQDQADQAHMQGDENQQPGAPRVGQQPPNNPFA